MPVYQSAPHPAPDSDYEPGTLRHLVAGNRGRLLDPRRTPVSIVGVRSKVGFVDVRVEGFEDTGAVWEVPLEEVTRYQFEPRGKRATATEVTTMQDAIERLSHDLIIEPAEEDRARTLERVVAATADADRWLDAKSEFFASGRSLPEPSTRRGDPHLAADLEARMRERSLWPMESAFARRFVSNPGSGEIVKGHRIVLAELGLVPYAGSIARDPATFMGDWSRGHRAEHIVARLGFVRAIFGRLGIAEVSLWRGLSAEGPLRRGVPRTFVSTTFDEAVARSHYEGAPERSTHVLKNRSVPVERLFMTYHETAAMNERFLEAEAIVLAADEDDWP